MDIFCNLNQFLDMMYEIGKHGMQIDIFLYNLKWLIDDVKNHKMISTIGYPLKKSWAKQVLKM